MLRDPASFEFITDILLWDFLILFGIHWLLSVCYVVPSPCFWAGMRRHAFMFF